MHTHTIVLFMKQQSNTIHKYALIMKVLLQPSVDVHIHVRASLRQKLMLPTLYMIVKEKLAFTKMKPLCRLEEWHSIDLGLGYKNDCACAAFIQFITCEQ